MPTPLRTQESLRGAVEPLGAPLRGHDELQIAEGRDDPDRFETEPAAASAGSNPTAPRTLYARFRRLGDDGEATEKSPPADDEGLRRAREREGAAAAAAFRSRMRERLERSACLGEPDDVDARRRTVARKIPRNALKEWNPRPELRHPRRFRPAPEPRLRLTAR